MPRDVLQQAVANECANETPETTIQQPTTSANSVNISLDHEDTSDEEHVVQKLSPAKVTESQINLGEQIRIKKLLRSNDQESNGSNNNNNNLSTKSLKIRDLRFNLKRQLQDTLSTQSENNEVTEQQPEASFQIKTLEQIRKEREEKEKLKENQMPEQESTGGDNKRGYSSDDSTQTSSRPIKLRRHRAVPISNAVKGNLIQKEPEKTVNLESNNLTSNHPTLLDNSPAVPESNSNQTTHSSTTYIDPVTQFTTESFDDLSFLELDGDLSLPVDVNAATNLANIDDDDDLMREIDEVINS